MTLSSLVPRHEGDTTHRVAGFAYPLECPTCHTAEHLVIESIRQHVPRIPGIVEAKYSCGRCASYCAHATTVEDIARILNASAVKPSGAGVLKFGGTYIHCGEPMEYMDSLVLPAGTPAPALGAPGCGGATPMPRRITVLRCACGFQVECAPGNGG